MQILNEVKNDGRKQIENKNRRKGNEKDNDKKLIFKNSRYYDKVPNK